MLQIFILAGLGIFSMISEILSIKKWLPYVTILVMIVNIASIFSGIEITGDWITTMYLETGLTKAFILITSALFLIWYLLFFKQFENEKNITEYISLFAFATSGGLMMLGYNHFVLLFLGLEILSIPIYVLAGSNKKSLKSNEAAFKYFIVGAFASSLLLLGIALIYGATGTFILSEISSSTLITDGGLYKNMGVLFVIFALAVKVSAVPFHYWVPDVYEGSPTPVTAYMSTLVKAFAAVATFRFISIIAGEDQSTGLYILAVLTMLVGNILGAIQDNPKRILAFSSIGHAGFMLMAILVSGDIGEKSLLYYIAAYSLSALLSFYVIYKVIKSDDLYQSIGDFNGLVKRNSLLALAMTISLLSMAGIPPLSGFFAKYFIFSAAYSKGLYPLVLVAIISSLIGIYYYFKFIIAMYGKDVEDGINGISLNIIEKVMVIFVIAAILLLGIFPDTVTTL